ncbi:ribonuclease H2 non-catalytic subunit [Pochonia chlamydosporia 170]|uniref:Ribonuclease H2 non-catalytic subunit n=1 Tax=Pochonia chlamydosporia 170 TaxID=1380566 RepID=A0A179FAY1_METCM|nr:ribonuclease H2 non-catalytic subunit [Pochonia chlamydosporia 170]OAQ62233.2 ribonuclease H2 non-catalytic subunit [Pochonia chlamydosporia 170]
MSSRQNHTMSTMSSQILTITDRKVAETSAPSLLPCQIQHDGYLARAETYWAPRNVKGNTTRKAYFRGRKLQGRAVTLPDQYEGVVLQQALGNKTSHNVVVAKPQNPDGPEKPIAIQQLQTLSRFDEIIVWSQDSPENCSSDPYMRVLDEWLVSANSLMVVRSMRTRSLAHWQHSPDICDPAGNICTAVFESRDATHGHGGLKRCCSIPNQGVFLATSNGCEELQLPGHFARWPTHAWV